MTAYLVWVPDLGEEKDARECEGFDAEAAAESYIESWGTSDGEYNTLSTGGYVVHVRPVAGGPVVRVRVTGEATITYYAEIIEEES